MSQKHDAIVIGAGPNGLVAATYLARAGKRVLVLERKECVGGVAVTEELIPGFHFSACTDALGGYLAPEISSDLGIAGSLEVVAADPLVASPQPDGTCLRIWRDTARTAAEIEPYSAADAARYPEFLDYMAGLARLVHGLMRITPPDLPDTTGRDLMSILGVAKPLRAVGRKQLAEFGRVLPMTAADLLNEWFESPVLKGAIAANGVRSMTWGPQEAGTAYLLLHRWAASGEGLLRSGGLVKGGIGVETADVVVSSADPRTTFFNLVDPAQLRASFVQYARHIKYRGSAARVHLALSQAPSFRGVDADGTPGMAGHIQIAPTLNYLQRAYDPIKYGDMSERPYLDISIPSLVDPSLAPAGQHTLSATVQYAPYRIEGGWDAGNRTRLLDTVLATLEEYAPGIGETVLESVVFTPVDLESRYGLPEGNLHHGEMTLDQLVYMRPLPGCARYSTPIEGLYLCGAGSHPGGCVTGLPGSNAARQILSGRP